MDDHLLDILVCPISKGRLQYDRERDELVSVAEKLAFPIRDGIPILLESEARRIDEPENAPEGEGENEAQGTGQAA